MLLRLMLKVLPVIDVTVTLYSSSVTPDTERLAAFRVSSSRRRFATVTPPAPLYLPSLLVARISAAVSAVRAAALALASRALSLWLENAGLAIAAMGAMS